MVNELILETFRFDWDEDLVLTVDAELKVEVAVDALAGVVVCFSVRRLAGGVRYPGEGVRLFGGVECTLVLLPLDLGMFCSTN
jgi:hypothetical protein